MFKIIMHGFPICFVLWWATLPTTIENVWESRDFKSVITHDVDLQKIVQVARGNYSYCA